MKMIKHYTVEEAKVTVEADVTLKAWAEKLQKEAEEEYLDYGNDYFSLCTNIDDETENKAWLAVYRDQGIQLEHFDSSDEEFYYITRLSIEQAILIGRDILKAIEP